MHTNWTPKTEDNDVADRIVQEQNSLIHLRILIQHLSWPQKIAVVQIACNQTGAETTQLIKLLPFTDKFDDRLQAAEILMTSLPPEILTQIAIEILENPND